MLSTVTPIGDNARYGTTPSPVGPSAGFPSAALMPIVFRSIASAVAGESDAAKSG